MLAIAGCGPRSWAGWLWRATLALLLSLLLAGCAASGAPEGAAAGGNATAVQATNSVPEVENETPTATRTQVSGLATPPTQPTPGTTEPAGTGGLPITLSVPAGWAQREVPDGLILLEDGASLASAELECPVFVVRRVPGAANRADLLASYALGGVLRQREIPLVIAGNPVDALDITISSPVTGRIYQVVLAPLMLKGEGLLFIASMPQGQAQRAWPILAGILGSIALNGD